LADAQHADSLAMGGTSGSSIPILVSRMRLCSVNNAKF
jgi:hypothetical protein